MNNNSDSISRNLTNSLQESEAFESGLDETIASSKEVDQALKENAMDAAADTLLNEATDNSAVAIQNKTLKIVEKRDAKIEKAKDVQESVLVRKEDADGLANEFSKQNREYRLKTDLLSTLAQAIGVGIREDSSPDEVLAFVLHRMRSEEADTDPAIVDKTLEFLLEVVTAQINRAPKGPIKTRLQTIFNAIKMAKENHYKANASKINTAAKIIGAVDSVIEETGQSMSETLEHYRAIIHNPPELQAMRKLYEEKGYEAMLKELKGLSRYLGTNFKRNNLENAELAQLANAARKMQALIGVYRQAKTTIGTIEHYLDIHDLFETKSALLSDEIERKDEIDEKASKEEYEEKSEE